MIGHTNLVNKNCINILQEKIFNQKKNISWSNNSNLQELSETSSISQRLVRHQKSKDKNHNLKPNLEFVYISVQFKVVEQINWKKICRKNSVNIFYCTFI